MVKCPKCEKEISDKARKCPHCSFVLKKSKVKTIIIYTVSIIIAFSVIYGVVIGIQNYQKQKAIQEYNDSVHETVMNFHDVFESVDEKIRNRNYSSLENLVDTMKKPINEFDKLPINEDSEFGQYIKSIKNNPMYTTFKAQYIDSDSIDLDYGLTSGGYAYLITVYTEKILEEELPKIDK